MIICDQERINVVVRLSNDSYILILYLNGWYLMVSPNIIKERPEIEPRCRLEEEQHGMLRLPAKSTELGHWYHWLRGDSVYSGTNCGKANRKVFNNQNPSK